jgi:hypothetical protein
MIIHSSYFATCGKNVNPIVTTLERMREGIGSEKKPRTFDTGSLPAPQMNRN